MTQVAYTVAGYVIGSYFGYPQLGAAIGSYLGALQAAPDQHSPRLADTETQSANYGASIPRIWGSDRTTGVLIWAGPMVEHVTEESAKGGLGPEAYTYSYTRSFAILIGKGPIENVRRIWADAELIYDKSEDATEAARAATYKLEQQLTFYKGTEDQLPDPTIEAVEGTGNVEAYRGMAYMVATDFSIDFFRRIPIFRFEVTSAPATSVTSTIYEPLIVYDWEKDPSDPSGEGRPVHPVLDEEGGWSESCTFTGVEQGNSGTVFDTVAVAQAAAFAADPFWYQPSAGAYSRTYAGFYYTSVTSTWSNQAGGATIEVDAQYVYPMLSNYRVTHEPMPDTTYSEEKPRETHIPLSNPAASLWYANRMVYVRQWSGSSAGAVPLGYSNTPYSQTTLGGGVTLTTWASYLLALQQVRVPTHDVKSAYPGSPIGKVARYWSAKRSGWRAELPSNSDFAVDRFGTVTPNYTFTIVSGTAKQLCAVEYRNGVLYQQALGPVLLPGDPNYNSSAYWDAQRAAALEAGTMQSDVTYPVVVSSYARGERPPGSYVLRESVSLADVVADVCTEAGLQFGQINVSQLEGDYVLGFTRGRRMPARSLLETLRAAYHFDYVESGGVLKFVKRGGAAVATLAADDLGVDVDGAKGSIVETQRDQEAELPISVQVVYRSLDALYETGAQESRRRVGGTSQMRGMELALVLEDDQAAQIADIALYDLWAQRVTRRLCTWRKWAKLEPTDVVEVVEGDFRHRVRIVDVSEQQGVLELDCRDDLAEVFTSYADGGVVAPPDSTIDAEGPTVAELLDIPLLRENESASPGFYAVATSVEGRWRGGRLFVKPPGAASYSIMAVFQASAAATMGHALTKLGDWTGGNIVDTANYVDVLLIHGELDSISHDDLLSELNVALVGDEILQFRTATLIDTNTYRLSNLLRGRLGTEWAEEEHAIGDRFVLLTPSTTINVPLSIGLHNVEISYKAASYFSTLNATGEQLMSCTGARLKPLSPAHLAAAPYATGGYQVKWIRRSRISEGWVNGGTVPVGERTESYRVRVLWGDVVQETQTVSTNTAIVGVGASMSGRTIEVCQISELIGVGFPATITIT